MTLSVVIFAPSKVLRSELRLGGKCSGTLSLDAEQLRPPAVDGGGVGPIVTGSESRFELRLEGGEDGGTESCAKGELDIGAADSEGDGVGRSLRRISGCGESGLGGGEDGGIDDDRG